MEIALSVRQMSSNCLPEGKYWHWATRCFVFSSWPNLSHSSAGFLVGHSEDEALPSHAWPRVKAKTPVKTKPYQSQVQFHLLLTDGQKNKGGTTLWNKEKTFFPCQHSVLLLFYWQVQAPPPCSRHRSYRQRTTLTGRRRHGKAWSAHRQVKTRTSNLSL